MHPINRIITHVAPHLDEIVAIWLLRHYGADEYPGVETAPILYWNEALSAQSADHHLAEGTLLIGVGGGRFDEHPSNGQARKSGQTATSLVAQALGLSKEPAFQRFFAFVNTDDLEGSTAAYDLARLVVTLHRAHSDDPQQVIDWTDTAIDGIMAAQQSFFAEAKSEYEAKACLSNFRHRGKRLTMASIETDNLQIVGFSRTQAGGRAALTIVRNSRGQVSILANPYNRLDLRDVAHVIRYEERVARGERDKLGWTDLEAEGTMAGIPEWYYQPEAGFLLNGSPTHPDVPATRLSLERISELATMALSSRSFHAEYEESCRQDSCVGNICPWYGLGLRRCRTIRFKMAQAEGRR